MANVKMLNVPHTSQNVITLKLYLYVFDRQLTLFFNNPLKQLLTVSAIFFTRYHHLKLDNIFRSAFFCFHHISIPNNSVPLLTYLMDFSKEKKTVTSELVFVQLY